MEAGAGQAVPPIRASLAKEWRRSCRRTSGMSIALRRVSQVRLMLRSFSPVREPTTRPLLGLPLQVWFEVAERVAGVVRRRENGSSFINDDFGILRGTRGLGGGSCARRLRWRRDDGELRHGRRELDRREFDDRHPDDRRPDDRRPDDRHPDDHDRRLDDHDRWILVVADRRLHGRVQFDDDAPGGLR